MTAPRPTIEPTTATQVAIAAVAGGGLAWLLFGTLQGQGVALPVLGPVAWGSVVLIAVGIAYLAARTHAAVQRRRESIDPQQAVTRLLLGKTSILGGAALGAAYLALVWLARAGWPAPLATERVLHGSIAALACVGWSLAGWFLERACRIPDDNDRDTPGEPHLDEPEDGREVA